MTTDEHLREIEANPPQTVEEWKAIMKPMDGKWIVTDGVIHVNDPDDVARFADWLTRLAARLRQLDRIYKQG